MSKLSFLLRFALYAFLSWFLLAVLWLALPSPSRESDDPNAYSTSVLRSGRTLTRVYEFQDFFPYTDPTAKVQWSRSTHRTAFAVSYTLSLCKQILTISGTETTLNLTLDRSLQLPHTSESFTTSVKVGDRDGINPTWFADADSMLLFWAIEKQPASIWLRAKWLEGGHQLQIWPESQSFNTGPDNQLQTGKVVEALLTLITSTTDGAASFQAIVPTLAASSSPSLTYPLRVGIMAVLVPAGLAVKGLFEVCGQLIAMLFGMIRFLAEILSVYLQWELVRWLWRGRPPVREYLTTSFPSKHVYIYLTREPAGTEGLDDEDMAALGPLPLRSIGDFFRSRSPLDDLLATYETTRFMVTPIQGTRSDDSANAAGTMTLEVEVQPALQQPVRLPGGEKDIEAGGGGR